MSTPAAAVKGEQQAHALEELEILKKYERNFGELEGFCHPENKVNFRAAKLWALSHE